MTTDEHPGRAALIQRLTVAYPRDAGPLGRIETK
jgi:hypothetical protein